MKIISEFDSSKSFLTAVKLNVTRLRDSLLCMIVNYQ